MATILIVDDEYDILFLLRMMLETAGHTVVEAENGAVAIELMSQGAHPDLVITDLMMPVMDGQELIHHLQRQERARDIPIILLSANPNGAVGAHAFVRKPFRHEDLVTCISTLLEQATV